MLYPLPSSSDSRRVGFSPAPRPHMDVGLCNLYMPRMLSPPRYVIPDLSGYFDPKKKARGYRPGLLSLTIFRKPQGLDEGPHNIGRTRLWQTPSTRRGRASRPPRPRSTTLDL